MNPDFMRDKVTVALLIVLGASARLIPHPWNFTPVMAIALYAGARATKLWIAPQKIRSDVHRGQCSEIRKYRLLLQR